MIGRVREMLCLEAECIAAFVDVALFAGHCAVEKVSGIELDAGLSGGNFKHTSARGIVGAGGEDETGVSGLAVENEVVVVAVAKDELFVAVIDARANFRRLGEVE